MKKGVRAVGWRVAFAGIANGAATGPRRLLGSRTVREDLLTFRTVRNDLLRNATLWPISANCPEHLLRTATVWLIPANCPSPFAIPASACSYQPQCGQFQQILRPVPSPFAIPANRRNRPLTVREASKPRRATPAIATTHLSTAAPFAKEPADARGRTHRTQT